MTAREWLIFSPIKAFVGGYARWVKNDNDPVQPDTQAFSAIQKMPISETGLTVPPNIPNFLFVQSHYTITPFLTGLRQNNPWIFLIRFNILLFFLPITCTKPGEWVRSSGLPLQSRVDHQNSFLTPLNLINSCVLKHSVNRIYYFRCHTGISDLKNRVPDSWPRPFK